MTHAPKHVEAAANVALKMMSFPTGTHPTKKQYDAVDLATAILAASDSIRLQGPASARQQQPRCQSLIRF
jgi:hypothetical protein